MRSTWLRLCSIVTGYLQMILFGNKNTFFFLLLSSSSPRFPDQRQKRDTAKHIWKRYCQSTSGNKQITIFDELFENILYNLLFLSSTTRLDFSKKPFLKRFTTSLQCLRRQLQIKRQNDIRVV